MVRFKLAVQDGTIQAVLGSLDDSRVGIIILEFNSCDDGPLEWRGHRFKHILDDLFGSYVLQQGLDGVDLAAPLHAPLSLGPSDAYTMQVDFFSRQGDERGRDEV